MSVVQAVLYRQAPCVAATVLTMQRRSLVVPSAIMILTIALAGCASGTNVAAGSGNEEGSAPVESSEPVVPASGNAAALTQAQAWLEAANLPPGAVRAETPIGSFSSYTGWPCGPYEELKAYWVVPDTTLVDAANWLIENPPADLMTTAFAPVSEEWGPFNSTTVGYIPRPDAQEGIVYTIAKVDGGVAVRAEVAAQTATATCPPLPDGATYGAPGQG